jgi:hypothetical protein
MLFNARLIGLAIALSNAKFGRADALSDGIQVQFRGINERLDHIREMWGCELRRAEGVADVRVKHLEER